MKALLVAMAIATANPVLVQPDSAGGQLILYSDVGSCNYGWYKGVSVNSAKLVVLDFCWRLRRDNGQIVFDNGCSAGIEEFNVVQDGLVWIRKYTM